MTALEEAAAQSAAVMGNLIKHNRGNLSPLVYLRRVRTKDLTPRQRDVFRNFARETHLKNMRNHAKSSNSRKVSPFRKICVNKKCTLKHLDDECDDKDFDRCEVTKSDEKQMRLVQRGFSHEKVRTRRRLRSSSKFRAEVSKGTGK